MHHPGPPRFMVTGDDIELAPRDPDPTATYSWQLIQTPDDSTVTLGDDPVEHFAPDVSGTYVAQLSAPDGEHELTIRVFPGELSPDTIHESGMSAGRSAGRSGSGIGSGFGRSGSGGSARPMPGGEGGRPRLTMDPSIKGDEAVIDATPDPHPGGDETPSDFDVEFQIDDRDDLDRDALRIADQELRIPLSALPDRARIYAVAVGEHGYSVPDAVEFSRSGSGSDESQAVDIARPYDPPAWAKNATLYEIYVREFADPDGDSTFDDIIDRLDYIESLGVDVLWLTPVLENDHAPHGYNITDFQQIASDLGSREDYERFIEAAHDRGLKVLFDLVCNHSARTHPYFEEAVENHDSEYRDWYEWRTETEPETYFDWEHIANFNFDHLPVRRHLLDVVDQWGPLVDGFRCDMAWAVPNNFWRELHDRCKERDSEFLLLDETIPYIPDFQSGLFDMHFDSTTYAALRRAGSGEDAETVLDAIDGRAQIGFPEHAAFMLYAENHDETRYIVDCGRAAAEAAVGAVFTLPGAPLLYAGQEFGQRGRRDRLAWDHADEELREHVKSLSAVRDEQPALSTDGDLLRVPYDVRDGVADSVVAYARVMEDENEAAVVVLNFGSDPATVDVSAATAETDLVSGDSIADRDDAGTTTVTVDSVAVLPTSTDAVN